MNHRHLIAVAVAAAIVVLAHADFAPQVRAQAAPAKRVVQPGPKSSSLAVRLRKNATRGARQGARKGFDIHGLNDWQVLRFATPQEAAAAAAQLRNDPDVLEVVEQHVTARVKRTNDTLFGQQWHLKNTGQSGGNNGIDLNVEPVWTGGNTGAGVRVAVVDDGLQTAHPDLSPNYSPTNSHDYVDDDADPSPDISGDFHGTACAGLVAAKGDNNLGVAGAAYNATLSGIRLLSASMTDADEAAALTHDMAANAIYSNSWGPFDNGDYADIGPLAKAAIINGVANGRGGLGNIYVWAGGNGRQSGDYANYDGYVSLPETIGVGSVHDTGAQSSYSESGANLMVVAPGSELSGEVVTTDLVGANGYDNSDYTFDFNGTSAAAPMVSGVIALMLAENAALTWRDVQHILARTSRKVSPTDAGWTQNSKGYWISHKFGFGLIDADAACNLASTWTTVGARVTTTSSTDNAALAIPDNNATGITRTINVPDSLFLEHVVVNFTSDHTDWEDLEVTLTSPGGTVSEMSKAHNGASPTANTWYFMSTRCWGEDAQGTWSLKVADRQPGQTGDLTSWDMTLYGTATEVISPLALVDPDPPDGANGVAYSYTFDAVNGTPPHTFSISAGSLPTGITLDTSTGEISGTPMANGTFNFTITVSTSGPSESDSAAVNIQISSVTPLTLTNTNAPDGAEDAAYTHTFGRSGGVAPFTFAIIAGSLPAGITLNTSSGEISGTPTANGTFNFTVEVSQPSPADSDSAAISIDIAQAAPTPLDITNMNAPDGEVGVAYSHTFGHTGGVGPYTFALTAGTLPPGLTLAADGELSGTPTTAGTYNLTVTVSQPTPAASATDVCTIEIGAASVAPVPGPKKKEDKRGFLGCAAGEDAAIPPMWLAAFGAVVWLRRRRKAASEV
ncbi:MAG: S8 family serine peptidase [Planctomycetes bacterium]|nr:S8 family serine peptidase [Planctomycetota bacterium]